MQEPHVNGKAVAAFLVNCSGLVCDSLILILDSELHGKEDLIPELPQ